MSSSTSRASTIIQRARDQAAIEQFDNESFRAGLDIFAREIDARPLRTAPGKQFLEGLAVKSLVTRLQVAEYARNHPEILRREIKRPVFIMGMPRTGTTLVSYLIGTDPNFRSLLRWEIATPVPPPTLATLKSDPRCVAMKEQDARNPDPFAHIHREAPDGPTECTFVMAHDFKALFMESLLCSPVYSNWMLETDLTSAYEYHRLFLTVLQSEAPGTWALKLPSHALGIRVLLKMYPDARVIWTHRDPFAAAGSLISMIEHAHRVTLTSPDNEFLVNNYPRQLAEHVHRPMAVQDESPSDPFYHLYFADLLRDPMAEMRKLYAWLGEAFADETEVRMRSWLADNPQGKFGKHTYSLERFGLSRQALLPHFENYLQRFQPDAEG